MRDETRAMGDEPWVARCVELEFTLDPRSDDLLVVQRIGLE